MSLEGGQANSNSGLGKLSELAASGAGNLKQPQIWQISTTNYCKWQVTFLHHNSMLSMTTSAFRETE